MKPEGSLAERDFPGLVQYLHEQRWSGSLTLTNAGVGKSVTVQDGRLVFASSSDRDDRLGEVLLRRGRISLRQFTDAGKAIGPGKRLGAILVEQGILTPKDLVKAVIEHTQEIIWGAFQWTEGRYRLQEGQTSAEAITLKISTPDLIMEGVRRIESWSRVDRGVGGIAAQYQRTEDYESVLQHMNLSFEKLSILTNMHEPRTVEEICADSTLADFDVCRTLWAFRVIGVIWRSDVAPVASKPSVEDEGLGFVLTEE
jgi:hypothetical protein